MFRGVCRDCHSQRQRELYAQNRERYDGYHHKWLNANREQFRATHRAYYQKHAERYKRLQRIYSQRYREKKRQSPVPQSHTDRVFAMLPTHDERRVCTIQDIVDATRLTEYRVRQILSKVERGEKVLPPDVAKRLLDYHGYYEERKGRRGKHG